MSDTNIKFNKDGKPTKDTMNYLFENDREKFLDFQDKYFTTGGTMNETPFDGAGKKMMDYVKGKLKKSK